MATVLGAGETALVSPIRGFEDARGFLYDIQITTAPVTDGSLSSCPPGEAVTWGKVDKDHYRRTATTRW